MGKQISVTINRFDGGISEDKRVDSSNKFSITKHFDTFTYKNKIVPHHQTIAYGAAVTASGFVKFLYAPYNTSDFRLYALGTATGVKAKIYILDTGDIANNAWTEPVNNASTLGSRSADVFFYYKNYIYMFANNAKLIRFDTTLSAAFNDNYQSMTYATVAQPVHHPNDDVAYFFYNNIVAKIDNTTWTDNVLTLPTNQTIISACAYGNYLAIGCITKGSADIRSIVYLWDRDSSIGTLTERIDLGEGKLLKLSNLNNQLVAVMMEYADNINGLYKGKILIKKVSGTSATVVNEITTDATITAQNPTFYERSNKLYIPLSATLNSDTRLGIWVIDENGNATLDFYESTATIYNGIYLVGNVWFISHSNDTQVVHTDANRGYSTTVPSIYESLIFNGGDSSMIKKLIGVSVTTEPLPTAGSVVLKYRLNLVLPDGTVTTQTSWTTIFTNTTDNSTKHDAINIESDGSNLPEFNEIQFQINSYGGAAITGFNFIMEEVGKRKYN